MPKIFKPGEIADQSGQYGTVDQHGAKLGTEVTVTKGEPFPPTPKAGEGYVLNDPTKHKS